MLCVRVCVCVCVCVCVFLRAFVYQLNLLLHWRVKSHLGVLFCCKIHTSLTISDTPCPYLSLAPTAKEPAPKNNFIMSSENRKLLVLCAL